MRKTHYGTAKAKKNSFLTLVAKTFEGIMVNKLLRRKLSLTSIYENVQKTNGGFSPTCGGKSSKKSSGFPERRISSLKMPLFSKKSGKLPDVSKIGVKQNNMTDVNSPDRIPLEVHNNESMSMIILILSLYAEIESKRKTALEVINEKGKAAIDVYNQLIDIWDDLLKSTSRFELLDETSPVSPMHYSENDHSESATETATFNLVYAAHKILADIFLLFRKTERAIQVYKYTVFL